MVTRAEDIFEIFESSFQDRNVIPDELMQVWLRKAVNKYSIELDPIEYNADCMEFTKQLDGYTMDTLASFMKMYYQQREVSKVNKRVSIVMKDISVDGNNGTKTAAREEYATDMEIAANMIHNQKPTAYV